MTSSEKPLMSGPVITIVSGVILLLSIALAPLIGSQALDYREVLAYLLDGQDSPGGLIFFQIRLPRVLAAVVTGSALATAGVVFQALLRNPLATPYTLGVASGSALGALLAIKTGLAITFLGFTSVQMCAFLGSLVTISLVYFLARRLGSISIYGMILAGVTLSYFFSAGILILHYIADFTETHQMIRWTIGGLDITDYQMILRSLPLLLIGFLYCIFNARTFNVLSTSEEMALSKGVNVPRAQFWAFVVASLMTGTVVALSGPIGFIGLIIPHLIRMVSGPDHRYLLPAAIFLGGGFLTLADSVARTVLAPVDLPVGIITTLIGGPFFLWLLVRRRTAVFS